MPVSSSGATPSFNFGAPGFGASYKSAVRAVGNTWGMNVPAFCECLARYENKVEIDETRVDADGIPILKISCEWSDNEKKLFENGKT